LVLRRIRKLIVYLHLTNESHSLLINNHSSLNNLFSVIIPLYNKAAYVEKAIRSVLSQTYQEFELIVVNDGSTDDSLKNLQFTIYNLQLPEEKIRIIEQQNQGVSIARNNGVKEAQYDFIAFLDADDWWEPTYLEEMKALIEEFPEAGIYGCGYYILKNRQKRVAPIGVEPDFEKGMINYCQVYAKTLCMPLWTGATIIKKTIFESEKGFKPNLKLGEDFDLWIRVAMKYPVAFLNKSLANYNQDVELSSRGVVEDKIYLPKNHFIFNLEYLNCEEKTNLDLKILLDKLRLYTLLRYRLQNAFISDVKIEIKKVNFKYQSFSDSLGYFLPVSVLNVYYKLRKIVSKWKKINK